jgi:hypothetical protein
VILSVGPRFINDVLADLEAGKEVIVNGKRFVVTAVTTDTMTIQTEDMLTVAEAQQPRKQPQQKPWFRQFQRSRW